CVSIPISSVCGLFLVFLEICKLLYCSVSPRPTPPAYHNPYPMDGHSFGGQYELCVVLGDLTDRLQGVAKSCTKGQQWLIGYSRDSYHGFRLSSEHVSSKGESVAARLGGGTRGG
ncbi:unnamed protein product, partial [Discosporangium mesarthrocarpum]